MSRFNALSTIVFVCILFGLGILTGLIIAKIIWPFCVSFNISESNIQPTVTEQTKTTPTPIATEDATVSLYFMNEENVLDCTHVSAATRTVSAQDYTLHTVIELLLVGPNATEKQSGVVSLIPQGTAVNNIRIEDSVAYVDFTAPLNTLAGSCAVQAARAQITNTLLQFPSITSVVISVDGESEDVLQP